jgi:hypothetical protein
MPSALSCWQHDANHCPAAEQVGSYLKIDFFETMALLLELPWQSSSFQSLPCGINNDLFVHGVTHLELLKFKTGSGVDHEKQDHPQRPGMDVLTIQADSVNA